MKNLTLTLLTLLPFSLFAQNDDYCICQEAEYEYQQSLNFVNSLQSAQVILIEHQQYQNRETPTLVFENESPRNVINLNQSPKKETVQKVKPSKEENFSVYTKKSYADAHRSWFGKKAKRKKKVRKFRGGCPSF